ncbi:MAG: right-handed parallel beta-helix repeat-containing protein, partial [Acidobacteriaceae bacterium]|nr:right-handed parallel beta-helix repeat-containing protein [Acidobacteriaceae bacterium]
SSLSTGAFRAAIQAAKAAGGGTVFVPAGTYSTGPIELVSNMTLYVDAGATLRFPAMKLPLAEGREQGIECIMPVPLIGGRHLENVSIVGQGTLTTDHQAWLNLLGRPEKNSAAGPGSVFGPEWNRLLDALEQHTPAPKQLYRAAAPHLRPSFVRTMDSKNVLIQRIHIVGSPMWAIHLLYTEKAVVDGVTVETYPGAQTDGIAVDSSRDVRISNSYIDTGDDGIVIKSGKDADGLRVNRPTENVTITNCNVHRAHGAVVLGSEIAGGIRNLVASNITCNGTQIGVRIKSRRGRGGVVENVRFDNWSMDNVPVGIDVTNYYIMEGETRTAEQPVSNRTPVFRNIAISNVSINHSRTPIQVEGLPEMPIRGLRIGNIIGSGDTGMVAYNTAGLELHNVRLNAGSGPAFLIRDSKELELDDVSSSEPLAGAPVVRLDRCPDAIVRNSRAFAGTGAFLSAAPGEKDRIIMLGNALTEARQPLEESNTDYWRTYQSAPDTN